MKNLLSTQIIHGGQESWLVVTQIKNLKHEIFSQLDELNSVTIKKYAINNSPTTNEDRGTLNWPVAYVNAEWILFKPHEIVNLYLTRVFAPFSEYSSKNYAKGLTHAINVMNNLSTKLLICDIYIPTNNISDFHSCICSLAELANVIVLLKIPISYTETNKFKLVFNYKSTNPVFSLTKQHIEEEERRKKSFQEYTARVERELKEGKPVLNIDLSIFEKEKPLTPKFNHSPKMLQLIYNGFYPDTKTLTKYCLVSKNKTYKQDYFQVHKENHTYFNPIPLEDLKYQIFIFEIFYPIDIINKMYLQLKRYTGRNELDFHIFKLIKLSDSEYRLVPIKS